MRAAHSTISLSLYIYIYICICFFLFSLSEIDKCCFLGVIVKHPNPQNARTPRSARAKNLTPELCLWSHGGPPGASAKGQRRTSSATEAALEPRSVRSRGFRVNDNDTKPDRHPRSCTGVLHYHPAAHLIIRGLRMMHRMAQQAPSFALWSTPWEQV